MSTSPANSKEDSSTLKALKKLYATLKKFFAKEFLWSVLTLVLSIPLALIAVYLIDKYATQKVMDALTSLSSGKSTFLPIYLVCVVGIYFSRTVAGAIKTMVKKKEAEIKQEIKK